MKEDGFFRMKRRLRDRVRDYMNGEHISKKRPLEESEYEYIQPKLRKRVHTSIIGHNQEETNKEFYYQYQEQKETKEIIEKQPHDVDHKHNVENSENSDDCKCCLSCFSCLIDKLNIFEKEAYYWYDKQIKPYIAKYI